MTSEFTETECEAYAKHFITKHLILNWEFVWSDKMTKAFGYCYENRVIKLSRNYFKLNKKFPAIVQNVVLHEIAHAMQYESMGYLSHDEHWKNYCIQIGAIPKACFNSKEVTIPCEKFALRNIFNGNVIQYIQLTFKLKSIPEALNEFHKRIELEEYETNTKVDYEVVWCGKQ